LTIIQKNLHLKQLKIGLQENRVKLIIKSIILNSKHQKILFTYLVAFGQTGGLEKVNRTILKCLSSFWEENIKVDAWSLYDNDTDSKYFPENNFRGFSKGKLKFVFELIKNARTWDKVIVGHINLASAIRLMKIFNPKLKIILIVHGIEVWDVLKSNKRWLLENADKIISVSNFTKKIIIRQSNVKTENIDVLPNCLDPYFPKEFISRKPAFLLDRYNLKFEIPVLLTITRINKKEGRKGYDTVIEALKKITQSDLSVDFKYLLCGKYEVDEYERLNQKIIESNLSGKVIITGFIKEGELIDHYRLADIYIMPSKKEGFGIVYIEAAACGLQIIAGNADGSAEALMSGEIGHLIDPDNQDEIENKLNGLLNNTIVKSEEISEITYKEYDFEKYKNNLKAIIENV